MPHELRKQILEARKLLRVDHRSSPADITKAFKRLVLIFHPDKAATRGEDPTAMTLKTIRLTSARDLLVEHIELHVEDVNGSVLAKEDDHVATRLARRWAFMKARSQ
jgi:hypothetical protein